VKPILWQRAIRSADLLPSVQHVGLVLSTYADQDGAGAHPGNSRLARDTGLSLRTVKAAIGHLRDAKWIEPDESQPVDNSGPGRPAAAWKLRHPDPR
jgi:predicted transcriptional regulator